MGVESYMHQYAKVVLASWLRKKVKIGSKFKGLANINLTLNDSPKLYAPMYNVYSEYPICKDKNGQIIGLQFGADLLDGSKLISNHGWDQWCQDNNTKFASKHNVPSSYELKKYIDSKELTILHIFDVVYIHPDTKNLECVFEIMHKHPVTEYKKKFIKEHSLKGYEISAEWIMNKVDSPFNVECINVFHAQCAQ